MSWIRFARLNQVIEELSPTASITQIKKAWDNFEDKVSLVSLLSDEYPMNNLGQKKAIKWVANHYEVFDDEVENYVNIYGDIGEGIYFFDDNGEDSGYKLSRIFALLCMDCSRIESNTYRVFCHEFGNMSALEKKWFLRYWIRKPRTGFGKRNVMKLLAAIYGKRQKDVKRHAMFNTLSTVVECYESGEEPASNLSYGNFVKPMLAKALPKSKWPRNKVIEYKYDGARYQIHKENDKVIIFNRKGVVVTNQFSDVCETVSNWDQPNFIIDTEIYPITNKGTPEKFQKMNVRFHSKDHDVAKMRCPVKLAVFDCLMFEGNSLIDETLETRMEYIKKFPNQAIREMNPDNSIPFYSTAISENFEGIMVKDLNGTYEPGKRSTNWIKYKPPRVELDVVITGARYGEGKRSGFMASFDIAVDDGDGNFINIGAIGTGFSDMDFLVLTNKLKPLVTEYEDETYKLLPRVVLEVTSDLVTKNENGTYGLRFPRLVSIRDDKPVSEINTIDDVKGMI